MTVRQHQRKRWLLPIGIILSGVVLAMPITNAFPEVDTLGPVEVGSLGNVTLIVSVVVAALTSFRHQYATIECPECSGRVEYFPSKHCTHGWRATPAIRVALALVKSHYLPNICSRLRERAVSWMPSESNLS